MTTTETRVESPSPVTAPGRQPHDAVAPGRRIQMDTRRRLLPGDGAVGVLCAAIVVCAAVGDLSADGAITLIVFLGAVWMWIRGDLDDTYVALVAALLLVVAGPLETDAFTATLGDDLIWLLVGAFILAAAVTASGLPDRVTARVVVVARTPRQLVHLLTATLLVTIFAIPATSGRAALALPVFTGLAAALSDRPRLVRCLAVLFPTIILVSAIGSLLGAGAHLVTNQILESATGQRIGFTDWLILGLPLAVVWSHLAAEITLLLFTRHQDRRTRLPVHPAAPDLPRQPLDAAQRHMLMLLAVVITAWCTEPLHGLNPAVVAIAGALLGVAPRLGTTTLPAAMKTVPWSLLLFMAATLAVATALVDSGAAHWLGHAVFAPFEMLGHRAAPGFVIGVIVLSIAAHLVLQSRSARSAVLIPLVVAIAPSVGIDPVAAAFISTAAAGFCQTLTSSAKPVAMFAASELVPGYTRRDLLRAAAALAPVSAILIAIFAFHLWPALGLPLYLS